MKDSSKNDSLVQFLQTEYPLIFNQYMNKIKYEDNVELIKGKVALFVRYDYLNKSSYEKVFIKNVDKENNTIMFLDKLGIEKIVRITNDGVATWYKHLIIQ